MRDGQRRREIQTDKTMGDGQRGREIQKNIDNASRTVRKRNTY